MPLYAIHFDKINSPFYYFTNDVPHRDFYLNYVQN